MSFPVVRNPEDDKNIEEISPVIAITIKITGTISEFEGLASRMRLESHEKQRHDNPGLQLGGSCCNFLMGDRSLTK